uniref:Leishmanolysin-like peptidase n=1 Tax=Brugia timori TaxID=42155 RepID=A0A0R3QTY9_9BILA
LRTNIVPPKTGGSECVRKAYCPNDEVTILVRPESRTKPPLLCLNNKKLFDSSKLVRGLNIAILNSKFYLTHFCLFFCFAFFFSYYAFI